MVAFSVTVAAAAPAAPTYVTDHAMVLVKTLPSTVIGTVSTPC